jgi:ATP-dependent exoDNAse (exonuclease V) alpha subunit
LSLDRVQVNIRDHFFSQGGMVYVALSRARSVEGLRLVGTPEGLRSRIKTDTKVLPWL